MIDRFKDAFLEEAFDLLNQLEQSLLELEENPDRVDAVFRIMHTIKGSSSMFGFDTVSRFAHEVETILDHVREGRIPVCRDLVDHTLAARDRIRELLTEPEEPSGEPADRSAGVLASFRRFADTYLQHASHDAPGRMKTGDAPNQLSVPGGEELLEHAVTYRIRFRPSRSMLRNGTDPLLLLAELEEMGECWIVLHADDIPPLDEIDPESCYALWDIALTTRRTGNAVRDVFIFVEDSCELAVEAEDHPDRQEEPAGTAEQDGSAFRTARGNARQELSASSIRVASEKLDRLVDLVGELVTVQASLSRAAARIGDGDLAVIGEQVERLTDELRDSTMSIRMVPIGTTFGKYRRFVRDLSSELGKDADLATFGGETELDKTVIERLSDPLIHIIRNSIDHGIESPEERARKGKPAKGTVRLSAHHSGASVLVTVHDDGRGLDRERIMRTARDRGMVAADADLPEEEAFGLIFAPGFSTAREVTQISGRGVGMDVVRKELERLNGSITVRSEPDRGTEITLRLPLTLAIIEGLLVEAGDDSYVLPLSAVEECLELEAEERTRHTSQRIVSNRGEALPYARLRELLDIPGELPDIEQIVVVNGDHGRIGFAVDRVIGDHQTVIKNLGKMYRNVEGVSGATILGDGSVALIIDVPQISEMAARSAATTTP